MIEACVLGLLHIHDHSFVDLFDQQVTGVASKLLNCLVSRNLSSALQNDNPELSSKTSPELIQRLKLMGYSEWRALLASIAAQLIDFVGKVLHVSQRLESVVSQNLASFQDVTCISPDDLQNKLHIINQLAVHTAHSRLHRFMVLRGKDAFFDRLSSTQMCDLRSVLDDFLHSLSKMCADVSSANQLLTFFHNQSQRCFSTFHEERRLKLSLIIDSERWCQADVPLEFQTLADRLTEQTISITNVVPNHTISSLSIKSNQPEEQRFALVGTVLLLFRITLEYCQFCFDLPELVSEVFSRLTDLLKLFNSRTCQLILGAGALQLIGLKKISTKNLSLAARSLQFVLFLLPLLRDFFTKDLFSSSAFKTRHKDLLKPANCDLKACHNFEQLIKLYSEHSMEIVSKLESIFDACIVSSFNEWRPRPPVPSAEMKSLAGHLMKFHEAINPVLPDPIVEDLILRSHVNLKRFLQQRLTQLNIRNDKGPLHGLVLSDLQFYITQFIQISSMELTLESFQDIWPPI